MKFNIICIVVAICLIPSQGLPFFEDRGLASVGEYDELPATELKRDKRTLTTICVEIKPSSPYEEPYFMCKGTDSPTKYSKGSTSSNSDSYSATKPSYNKQQSKPSSSYVSDGGESDSYHSGGAKKNLDYGHTPASKPLEYHGEQYSKYDKPSAPPSTYDSAHQEYSAPSPSSKPSYDKIPSSYNEHGGIHHSDASYHNYEVPPKASSYGSVKPSSYADHHHDSHHQDDYAKLHHKVTSYSANPQTYSQHDQPSSSVYDHRQPTSSGGYSKPSSSYEGHTAPGGYSKPSSSSYELSEYSKPSSYDHSSTHPSSYNAESHSKLPYDGHSYSAPPETKVLYSKPAFYPSKQQSYEHADNTQYGQPKSSYNEQPSSAKPYSKPSVHQDYGKPASTYAPPNEQHLAGYASPQPQNYRMMPQELMQPTWETQPQQYDGFGYRSQGAPMEYQNLETPRMMNPESQMHNTGLDGPLRFDLSSDTDPEAPTLQSPYRHQTYSSPAHYGHHQSPLYGPVAPSYAPAPVHYAPAAPSYPVYPSAAQSPMYVPLPVPSTSYAPTAPSSYAPPSAPSSYGSAVPACGQNYMYSFQPVIMSVPCYSMSAGYTSLGSPANPLLDHSGARSDSNSETNPKSTEDHSEESHDQTNDKKTDSEVQNSQPTSPKKFENLKKPSDIPSSEEKQHQQQQQQQVVAADKNNNSQDQVVGAGPEKPINEAQITQNGGAPVTQPKNPEVPNTKEAFNAMMKMARIAAQLNKDDGTNQGPTDGPLGASGGPSATSGQGNGKPAEPLPQFSRTQ